MLYRTKPPFLCRWWLALSGDYQVPIHILSLVTTKTQKSINRYQIILNVEGTEWNPAQSKNWLCVSSMCLLRSLWSQFGLQVLRILYKKTHRESWCHQVKARLGEGWVKVENQLKNLFMIPCIFPSIDARGKYKKGGILASENSSCWWSRLYSRIRSIAVIHLKLSKNKEF